MWGVSNSKIDRLFACLIVGLLVSVSSFAFAEIDGGGVADGDTIAIDGDVDNAGGCRSVSDCNAGETCRYDGRCIPTTCALNSDCNYADFSCRKQDGAAEGICAATLCVIDADCYETELCRDDGRCITNLCSTDEDCGAEDYSCRVDGVCAPIECMRDADCPPNMQCHQVGIEEDGDIENETEIEVDKDKDLILVNRCINDPTVYIEGGVGNCQSVNGTQSAGALVLFAILLAGIVRRRVRD